MHNVATAASSQNVDPIHHIDCVLRQNHWAARISLGIRANNHFPLKKQIKLRLLFLLASFLGCVAAFAPTQRKAAGVAQLDMVSRRNAMLGIISATTVVPEAVHAFSQQLDDYAYEPQQQATNGKCDLNSAFVGD